MGKERIEISLIEIVGINFCRMHCGHKSDKYIFKYRLIVEKYFNRYLTQKEVVHHINGDTSNDRPENLYLFANQQDHTKFHRYPYNLQSNIIGFKV